MHARRGRDMLRPVMTSDTNVVPLQRPHDAVDDAVHLCCSYARQPFVDDADREAHLAAAAELARLEGPQRAARARGLAAMLDAR